MEAMANEKQNDEMPPLIEDNPNGPMDSSLVAAFSLHVQSLFLFPNS